MRLGWLDAMKGIAILWIVFFHFFTTYDSGQFGWPLSRGYFASFMTQCRPASMLASVGCTMEGFFVAGAQLGFHAVGVFLVLSGFGLAYSSSKPGALKGGWLNWYKRRLLRLFPMYWAAHLIYLVSPFVARPEPIDYRFLLSFLGDRIYPLDMIFYYLNPAWWYFGLLLELYFVFPILYRLLQRVGPLWFLVICGLITVGSRYLLLIVLPVDGNYVQGAFFGARLWEFAFGIFLGVVSRQSPVLVAKRLFSGWSLAMGSAIYLLGLLSYPSLYGTLLTYTLTDALVGTGLFLILAHIARRRHMIPAAGKMLVYVGTYSYGLYLLHQPYVIYFGSRMRDLDLVNFTVLAAAIIAVIFMLGAPLEKQLNKWTTQLLNRSWGRRSTASTPST
jgi:peptidoglycan/LPS O-acetylase OafA/YrhL